MPSRKLTAHCPNCGCKNHLRAAHCNQCGGRLSEDRLVKDEDGRAKLYVDIAHPINSACREMIQHRVIQEFRVEVDRSKQPGYHSTYDDYDHDVELPVERPADAKREVAPRTSTQVQPPEPQPRSPHKVPAPQTARHTPQTAHQTPHSRPAQAGGKRDFGAGIF
jgi:stage V sporulation protein G